MVGILFVITNIQKSQKKPPAGSLAATCDRTQMWTAGMDGSPKKRPESEKSGQPKIEILAPLTFRDY